MTSVYLGTDFCVCRDTAPTFNHIHSTSTAKPPQTSTKSLHRRGRSSIDKSQVSKPFPILAHDETDLFDLIASGSVQTKSRGIPKAAEKKVKINSPEPTKSTPQHKPKVPANISSQSWYTPAPAQSLANGALQRSVSNTTPRTTPSKVDVGRANSTKDFRRHGRTESEVRRDGVEPTKRRVHKNLITHPDCPWVESTNNPTAHHGYLVQHRPVRAATGGSYESDETAVEGGASARVDAKKEEEATTPAKFVQDTIRPTVRLVSKPLPDLPAFDSLSSRWSASTGSVYSDYDPKFSYDRVLSMFPNPPEDLPNAARFNDLKDSNSLSTPPVFMSCPNPSSSSVVTITPMTAPEHSAVKPLTLKAYPKSKFATIIRQNPRASRFNTRLQDSIIIRDGCAYPQAAVEGSIHTSSIRTAGTTSTLRQRSSSFNLPQDQNQPGRVSMPEALLWLHRRQISEDERIAQEGLERKREYETEDCIEWNDPLSMAELGFNLQYKGFSPNVEDRREREPKTPRQDPGTTWEEFGCIRPYKEVFPDVKERDLGGKDGCGLKGKGWLGFGYIRLCKRVSPDIKVQDLKGKDEDWRTWL